MLLVLNMSEQCGNMHLHHFNTPSLQVVISPSFQTRSSFFQQLKLISPGQLAALFVALQ